MPQNDNHFAQLNLLEIARNTMIHEGFDPDFPASVRAELATLDTGNGLPAGQTRDLRKLLWSSIDNSDSRDLDQVEYAERVGEDIKVCVGIADVDSYVSKGSAIDQHAFENTTSV